MSDSLIFGGVESARPGPEFYIAALAPRFKWPGAVPLAGAAVDAFFPVELGCAPPLGIGEGLAGTDLDAELRVAADA